MYCDPPGGKKIRTAACEGNSVSGTVTDPTRSAAPTKAISRATSCSLHQTRTERGQRMAADLVTRYSELDSL